MSQTEIPDEEMVSISKSNLFNMLKSLLNPLFSKSADIYSWWFDETDEEKHDLTFSEFNGQMDEIKLAIQQLHQYDNVLPLLAGYNSEGKIPFADSISKHTTHLLDMAREMIQAANINPQEGITAYLTRRLDLPPGI